MYYRQESIILYDDNIGEYIEFIDMAPGKGFGSGYSKWERRNCTHWSREDKATLNDFLLIDPVQFGHPEVVRHVKQFLKSLIK